MNMRNDLKPLIIFLNNSISAVSIAVLKRGFKEKLKKKGSKRNEQNGFIPINLGFYCCV